MMTDVRTWTIFPNLDDGRPYDPALDEKVRVVEVGSELEAMIAEVLEDADRLGAASEDEWWGHVARAVVARLSEGMKG
jgi:hypothetical protein